MSCFIGGTTTRFSRTCRSSGAKDQKAGLLDRVVRNFIMNNAKVCISVCAETADEFNRKVKEAAKMADVVELRFDCLDTTDVRPFLDSLPAIDKQYLFTFRPKEQGGRGNISFTERLKFWEHLFRQDRDNEMIDIEFDLRGQQIFDSASATTIVSSHDFTGRSESAPLDNIQNDQLPRKVVKIAVQANDITDSIGVWKLLVKANRQNRQIIPIAMGEAGKWTRILGLAHGAFMTYASLEAGDETAPGQISAHDLINVFRVKQLDENTAVYGIIGGNTSYSVSPYMHNAAFRGAGINSVFVPLQVTGLDEFMRRMVKPEAREIELNFKGFSITNPHKQTIIKHLDFVDETAEKIGAVNTVKIDGEKFYGYNTDAPGFIAPLKKMLGDLSGANAAVVGAGGAARACIYSLQQEGCKVSILARDPQKAETLAQELKIDILKLTTDRGPLTAAFDIIVNATPLGTKGEQENETAVTAEQLKSVKLVYDLVYNPAETRLIREAKRAGIPTIGGIEMLVGQGVKQFEIWMGAEAPIEEMRSAVRKRLNL